MEKSQKTQPSAGETTPPGTLVDFDSVKLLILIIGVGIALAFVAGNRTKPSASAPATPWDLQSVLIAIGPWILIFLIFYVYILRNLQSHPMLQTNNDATALVDCGRLDEAEALLKGLEKAAGGNATMRGVVEWNLATILAERGNFETAAPRLEKVLGESWLKAKANHSFRVALTAAMAELCVMNEETESASKYLEALGNEEHPYLRGTLWRAQVLLAARKKDYGHAAHLAGEYWREAEAATFTPARNRFRLAWALALQELNAAAHAAQIESLVAGVRPFWKGQFIPLVAKWPEMRDFLVQHKLTDEYAID